LARGEICSAACFSLFIIDPEADLVSSGGVIVAGLGRDEQFNIANLQNSILMKSLLFTVVALFALAPLTRADVTVKISDVHLCCDKCVKAADKTVTSVDGAKAAISKEDRTIEITAPDNATAQKVADALVKAGFFGTSGDANIKMDASTGAKGAKVQTLTVKGVHLCCPKCVKAVHETVTGVSGVTGDTATKGAESFTVTGDFNDADVFTALQKAGLTGKAGD
jgi:copper chaperone CopZ